MPSYTPARAGSTLVLVHAGRALLVECPEDAARVEALWSTVTGAASPQAVLEVLAADGITRTPAFALVELGRDGSASCIVRGSTPVRLVSADGDRTVDARHATTWVETVVAGVTHVSVGETAGVALPLTEGVAWASALTLLGAAAVEAPVRVSEVTLAPASIPEHTITPSPEEDEAPEAPDEPDEEGEPDEPDIPIPDDATVVIERAPDDSTVLVERAVRPPRLAAEAPAVADALGGEHDGQTVLSDDIRRLRREAGTAAPRTPVSAPVPAAPRHVLELSTGGSHPLEGVALVGRAPSAAKVSGGRIPALITIPGDQDISRNHVQIAVEGDTVVVTDLHSRNGTSVRIPGRPPQQLRAGEATAVLVGTVVDLGGGVTITVGQQQ